MRLLSFFICNPTLSTDECTAYENILCYHPPETDTDTQMNEAGLCIALLRLEDRFCGSSSPSSTRRVVRSVTLQRKRYVIVPLEDELFAVAITNREIVRPTLAHVPYMLGGGMPTASRTNSADLLASGTDYQQMIDAQHHGNASYPSTQSSASGASGSGKKSSPTSTASQQQSPSFTFEAGSAAHASPRSAPASSALWEVPRFIPHPNDEIDEYVIEIVERMVSMTHHMFTMMFGSIQWNYRKTCILESDERRGARKRPREIVTDDDREYEDERREQRAALESTLRFGFLNRLLTAIHAATSMSHSLEGSFACPEGVDILPLGPEMHLTVSSLASQLANAHPGAIRDTLVVSGLKMVFSTLQVRDTTTLFYLMKYYSTQGKPSASGSERVAPSGGSASQQRRQALRRSATAGMDEDLLDEYGWLSPEFVVKSETRRSDFLRPAVGVMCDNQGRERSPEPHRPLPLPVVDRVEFGFPFIFLGDNDPVGVYARDFGRFRFVFLVNEKYLRIAELRNAFELSMQDCLQSSAIPAMLCQWSLALDAHARPGDAKAALLSAAQNRQSNAVESEFLYYYRSTAISQVRSSIVQRLAACRGSLVAPLCADDPSRHLRTGAGTQRRSGLVRQLLLLAGEDELSQPRELKKLSVDERESVHLLDCLRSDVLRNTRGASASTYLLVRKRTWASVLVSGLRDLSCVVLDKGSVSEAEESVELLTRLVFYYAHRPPGL